ncbi:MAG: hypothetical protein ACPGVD_04700 [Flavobacteriales bacterium]
MRLITLLFLFASSIGFSQFYTPTQIDAIHTGLSAHEGDMYKDTVNDLQYIGVTDGSLKLLSPYLVRVIAKTADYTISMGESSAVITFNSSTPVTLTIPAGLPVGYNISVYQIGAGQVTIVGAGGVTLKNRLSTFKTAGKDSGAGIICTSTNVFHITGDLKK